MERFLSFLPGIPSFNTPPQHRHLSVSPIPVNTTAENANKEDDHFNPRICIHEADDPFVTIALMRTDRGFACFNYVYGKEKKIVTQFCSNTSLSTITNYVVDCLTPSTMYHMRTNIGTTMETVDTSTMQLRLEHILEYISAIHRASTPH